MIIEFSGVDGSGKSTLMDHLRGFLNARGVPCIERQLRSTYKRILADIARNEGHGHWSSLYPVEEVELAHAMEMLTTVMSTVVPLDQSYQVIVTDTYVRRWLATAHRWGVGNVERLAMVYRRLPIPDLSFHLSIDPLAAFDRLHARPKLDHIPNLASSRRLAAYSDAFEATTALCGYEPHVVRTDRPLAETVAEVVAEVQRWDRLNDARLLGSNSAE